jgi:DedD protein
MAADGLKQRLIGGAALLVIGVVAWFWLLSGDSPVDPVARETQIPPAPDIKPFTVPEPAAPADVAPLEQPPAPVAQASAIAARQQPDIAAKPTPAPTPAPRPVAASPAAAKPKPVAPVTPAPETFELDQQGLPVAWVVQVGLFSTQANADRIKETLQGKGFKAYTQAVKTPKPGVKVFVGPKLSRERADAQKKAIDQALKTNTMVVRFAP